jgi:hypothetical protein
LTWTGSSGTSWSNAGNWTPSAVPATGDSLIFPASAANLTNSNDLASGTTFNSITIQGAGYDLTGNAIGLTAGVTTSYASGTSIDAIPTTLNAIVSPFTVARGGTLDVNAVLSGPAGVNLTGGGTLDLMQANTYTGATTLASSTTLLIDSPGAIGGVQDTGGLLGGIGGTVGAVNSVGGSILPGHPASSTTTGQAVPGQLTANGSVTLDSTSTFAALLNGKSPGNGTTGYSQLVASSGTVGLNGATLATALGTSYVPTVGDQLVIIQNNTGAPINGVFANSPEGAAVNVGNSLFRISYLGTTGAGNSVVLSAVSATSTTTLLPVALPIAPNQPITLTAQVTGSLGTPTGIVQFFNGNPSAGGTLLGTGTLNTSGIATATIGSLGNTGSNTAIYAVYVPTPTDFTYAGSTSAPISFATTTTLTSSSPVSGVGEPVTFTATVAPASAGAGTPTGSVAFSIDGTTVATVPLNATTGQASYTTSSLAIGTHAVVATFVPNAPFLSSVSSTLTQSVSTAGTQTIVSIVPVRNGRGKVVRYEVLAQVESLTAGIGTPTGSVTYFINGRSTSVTLPLNGGVAVLPQGGPRLLNHFVYARYNGSGGFLASASTQLYVSHRLLYSLSRTAARQAVPAGPLDRHRRG